MKTKLETKDKKILYELDINSRETNSRIAKKVRLSKQVVGLRIKKLLQEGMIKNYYSVIDPSKLGFTIHKIFLRLQNLDKDKEKKIIDFLTNHPNVVWIASCDGKFDLAFGTWAKDIEFLNQTLKELNKKFGENIIERQIATIIKGDYFTRDYLVEKDKIRDSRESSFGAIPSPEKIDSKDWKILSLISNNSRISTVDLSRNINLGVDAISERIKKLEKYGIIKHYNFVPNESKYPYLHYKVLTGLRNISEEKENSLLEYCKQNPNIVYIVKSLGPWEFEIDLEVESVEQFRNIMMEIKTKFSDILKDYSSLNIYQVHKYNFCPSILS